MSNRRTSERFRVPADSFEHIVIEEITEEPEERTQPMRLPFLALLAERDPLVQTRLNLRRTLALEAERLADEDRPTDPMFPGKR